MGNFASAICVATPMTCIFEMFILTPYDFQSSTLSFIDGYDTDDSSNINEVSFVSALSSLLPIYCLSFWITISNLSFLIDFCLDFMVLFDTIDSAVLGFFIRSTCYSEGFDLFCILFINANIWSFNYTLWQNINYFN
jgi:hypothetical protein